MAPARNALPALSDPPPLAIGHPAAPEGRAAASRRRAPPFGIVGSLALHALPALWLLQWMQPPAALPATIPIRLVIEQPPPPPPEAKREAKPKEQKPPPGPLASEEFGDVSAPPKPDAPELVAPPQPAPPEPAASLPSAKPIPPPERRPKQSAPAQPTPSPHAASRPARFPGPAATRDEYLAYCMGLIRRYNDMLSGSFLAGRRGRTVLALEVLDDGTIARVAVKESSGFHDIDARVEQMVAAVRRFPPLPQWIQTSSVTLNYVQSFPDGMTPR